MEITYPEPVCGLSPSHAHYFTQTTDGIWVCGYCSAAMWLPRNWDEAWDFARNIKRLGRDKAYRKLLQHRPEVRRMLEDLISKDVKDGTTI